MYEIEKDVPVPRHLNVKYPFEKMEIGDSFTESLKKRNRIASAAMTYGLRNDVKFTVRKINDDTLRVWRVK